MTNNAGSEHYQELENLSDKVLKNRQEQNAIRRNLGQFVPDVYSIVEKISDEEVKKIITDAFDNIADKDLFQDVGDVTDETSEQLGNVLEGKKSTKANTLMKLAFILEKDDSASIRATIIQKVATDFVKKTFDTKSILETIKLVKTEGMLFAQEVFMAGLYRYWDLVKENLMIKGDHDGQVGKLYEKKVQNMFKYFSVNKNIQDDYENYEKASKMKQSFSTLSGSKEGEQERDYIQTDIDKQLQRQQLEEYCALNSTIMDEIVEGGREGFEEVANKHGLDDEERAIIGEILAPVVIAADSVSTLKQQEETAFDANPEYFYMKRRRKIFRLRRFLKEGKIVETPYVKKIINRILPSLQKDPPKPVYLYGELGSGKTELAKHIALTRFKKQPVVLPGHKNMTINEIKGGLKLERQGVFQDLIKMMKNLGFTGEVEKLEDVESLHMTADKKADIVKKLTEGYMKKVESEVEGEMTDEMKEEYKENFKLQMTDFFNNPVVTIGYLGAMYQAMKEGRPLIIDEVNSIPHEVLIMMNDLLTLRTGDVPPPINGLKGFEINEGFCVIMTGNPFGKRYQFGRTDLDPALLSRLDKVEYNYLPQIYDNDAMFETHYMYENLPEDTDMKELEEMKNENEIFTMMMVMLMDNNLGARLPEFDLVRADKDNVSRVGVFQKLFSLSRAVKIFMDAFSDKAISSDLAENISVNPNASTAKEHLPKSFKTTLSIRTLKDILEYWAQDDFRMDLDYYIREYFVNQSQTDEEREFFYKTFQWFGFFKSEGWPQAVPPGEEEMERELRLRNRLKNFHISDVDAYDLDPDRGIKELSEHYKVKTSYFTNAELVEFLYSKAPERAQDEYNELEEDELDFSMDLDNINALYGELRECISRAMVIVQKVEIELDSKIFEFLMFKFDDSDYQSQFNEYIDLLNGLIEYFEELISNNNLEGEDAEEMGEVAGNMRDLMSKMQKASK